MVLVFALRNGKSQSCGCLKREQVGTLVSRTRWQGSHGLSRHPLYQLWKRVNRRCYDTTAHNYRWYGGRGISVWEPWRHDAGVFIEYVEQNMGPRPDGMSLDRRDNDGNYEPGNLRWATALEQAKNRRSRLPTGPPRPGT
jgi:Staphylococcus phage HNH endonuclease